MGEGGIDTTGVAVSGEPMADLFDVDLAGWREQLPQTHEHYATFGEKLPRELHALLDRFDQRLHAG